MEGGSWTTSALYLQGISLVRRNGEWHHFDPLGTAGVITGSNAAVLSNNLYDVFGVLRYGQGSAQTPWRWLIFKYGEETGMLAISRSAEQYIPQADVSTRFLPGIANTSATAVTIPLRFPKLPGVNPACLGCLASSPFFIAYFADCGWPWRPGWRDCFNRYWDAFLQECTADVFCSGAMLACLFICGIDTPKVGKWLRKLFKWMATPTKH